MKRSAWWVIWAAGLFLLAGCHQTTAGLPMASPTQPPIVGTLVAQTLSAANTSVLSPSAIPQTPPSALAATRVALQPMVTTQPSSTLPAASTTAGDSPPPTAAPTMASTAVQTPVAAPSQTVDAPVAVSATPTQAPTSPPADGDCVDKAGFFADVTIPDNTLIEKNAPFTKTWRFRNVGTCQWGEGYQVVFANGHMMSGPPSLPLPSTAPGDTVDVSINFKAPAEGGTYAGDWQFQNAKGKRFGVNSHGEDLFWVIIKVDWGPGVGPTPTSPAVDCAYQRKSDEEAKILQFINAARAANGLPILSLQNQLSAAAQAHSSDMACNSFLDHSGSDKSTHAARLVSQGYRASYESENIYAGGAAEDAFKWWMNSPIHRANILSPKVTQIGISAVYFRGSTFGDYYTLNFAHP